MSFHKKKQIYYYYYDYNYDMTTTATTTTFSSCLTSLFFWRSLQFTLNAWVLGEIF